MRSIPRYRPSIPNRGMRAAVGLALLLCASALSAATFGMERAALTALDLAAAWLPAAWLTDKYVHKYPQRYLTYVLASHLKAAVAMALGLALLGWVGAFVSSAPGAVWKGFALFTLADLIVSLFRRPDPDLSAAPASPGSPSAPESPAGKSGKSDLPAAHTPSVDSAALSARSGAVLGQAAAEFLARYLPHGQVGNSRLLVCDETALLEPELDQHPAALAAVRVRINDVRRINRLLLGCTGRLAMGGYLFCRYLPHDVVERRLKERFCGFRRLLAYGWHFLWHRAFPKIPRVNAIYFALTQGRNRVLSKVEMWGRLSFCGMHVIAEEDIGGEKYVLAQRVAPPSENRRPSFHPVVGLEKVGLGGKIIRTHKIRTMFPFSEFLQKRIFEDHGLAETGKFKNDFRLTEYGRFFRKYWVDELPQLFDWLRGEIKLVGIRATSRHYLSLYPQSFVDLYVQVKPGLVPPLFDETTNGFEQIVAVELRYLERYLEKPFRTDLRYLSRTAVDIFVRGVRSK